LLSFFFQTCIFFFFFFYLRSAALYLLYLALIHVFYRQMPELVEHGHVYIAQPPLYKVKVGKEERYFKDDHERAQFMLSQALVGASLLPKKGGQPIEGKTLEDLAKTYLFGEAIVARASKIIDTEALAALMRGVKIDLSSPQSAGASALRLKQAMAANGNGVNVSARYDGQKRAPPARDRAGSPWKCPNQRARR